jgi:NADPH:quinone reductase-like Zn-dependent oxidoreductase
MPVVLQFDNPGPPTVLKFRDIPVPKLGPKEVHYRVLAFGNNRADLFYMADNYYNSPAYPARLGHDAAGIVEAVGAEVTQFKIGDHVSSIAQEQGRYCVNGEFAITPEEYLAHWPKGFNALEAASVWSSAITAYYTFVELAKVGPGDTVLITAASGTAGTGAIQMAKLLGAKVIATSRTREKEAFLRSVGADEVIASNEVKVSDEVMRLTGGKGARVVFDMIAGGFVGQYIDGLADRGLVYLVGTLEGEVSITVPLLRLFHTGGSITGLSIFNQHRHKDQLQRAKTFISDALNRGQFKPIIDRVFDFVDSIESYHYMEANAQQGKIIVRVSADAERRL